MSVSYEAAMGTLTSMFGDVDKEVIAMILQANGGHMEKTVENLLAMSGGAGAPGQSPPPRRAPVQQQTPPRQSQPQIIQSPYQPQLYQQQPGMQQYQQYPPVHPMQQPQQQPYPSQPQIINNYIPAAISPNQYPYQQQQQPPQSYRREEYKQGGPPPAHPVHAPPPAVQRAPAPPQPDLMIPDDFMRPPTFFQAIMMGAQPMMQPQQQQQLQPAPADIAQASPASAASQIEQDHLLAQMLQDEQFMNDLARNPERYRIAAAGGGQQQLAAPGVANASSANVSPSIRPQPQPQSIPDAKLSAPPAHPHPDFEARARSASGNPPASVVQAGGAGGAMAMGSEPLNPRLQQLEHGGPSAVTKEQQSSFAKRWSSLTSAAREKLSRLSERFKKDPAHDADMDGGGAYQNMPLGNGDEEHEAAAAKGKGRPIKLNDIRFAEANDEPDPSANANFLSAEQAASMQASYHAAPPAAKQSKKKKNALLVDDDEADPFGEGANGSDVDEDAAQSSFRYMQRDNSVDSVSHSSSGGVSVLPQMSRTISGVEANEAENVHSDGEEEGGGGGYRPPRMPQQSIQSERIILSPSQFQHGSSVGASSSSSAQKQHARRKSSSAALVDPPSDEDEDTPSLPAQRKRSSAGGIAPGKRGSKPLLEDM